jgi:hypothetical protein
MQGVLGKQFQSPFLVCGVAVMVLEEVTHVETLLGSLNEPANNGGIP